MTSPDGDALIQAASPADRQKAAQTLLDVHDARLALENATLQSIADKLKASEQRIVVGTEAVGSALASLNDLAQILNTVGDLLTTVGQIVTLV